MRESGLAVPGEVLLAEQHSQRLWMCESARLDRLFESRCDALAVDGLSGQLAVADHGRSLTYLELDARANQLARYLRTLGLGAGDRVGLVLDRSAERYVGMLGVLKIGAVYVPFDLSSISERMPRLLADVGVRTVLSTSRAAARLAQPIHVAGTGARVVHLDRVAPMIGEQDPRRLVDAERGVQGEQIAAITYSSDPSGWPDWVAIDHRSACDFVMAAADIYGIGRWDRVFQGAPVGSGCAVEEIWVSWASGATLVPAPPGRRLFGWNLSTWLAGQRVAAMWCPPRLLATIESELPELRSVLVTGTPCPAALVTRWHKQGRRLLGLYAPVEAAVSAFWTELHPDKPVTIGASLPGRSTVILDTDTPVQVLPHGWIGEIGLAGSVHARGYPAREDDIVTASIPASADTPAFSPGRIYRTGDLGRMAPDGNIEYLGRIGEQGDQHCYCTELGDTDCPDLPYVADPVELAGPHPVAVAPTVAGSAELEPGERPGESEHALGALLAEVLGVDSVSVNAHVFDDLGADSMVMARFCAKVRKRDDLPTVSMKDVYQHPTIAGLARAFAPAPAPGSAAVGAGRAVGAEFAAVLAEILGAGAVAVDAHVFDDLGADSMVMARFCAKVRKRDDLPTVSMKDVYAHPTLAGLAGASTLAHETAPPVQPSDPPMITMSTARMTRAVRDAWRRPMPAAGTPRYLLCGLLQMLFLLGYPSLTGFAAITGYDWVAQGTGLVDVYLRSVVVGSATFVGLCALPILFKWMLIGRWDRREIRVWSMAYVRFWIVKTMVQRNPMALFVGSPLYVVYLRLLGAKIGPGAVILSRNVPVCTDLLTIGAGTVIRKDSFFTGYRAHDGAIQTGAVTLSTNVLVGEMTVLDIETSLGDGAQLGHTSSLQTGQAVPAGERWNGSPARPTGVDYRSVATQHISTLRRMTFSAVQLLNVLLVGLPLATGGLIMLLLEFPQMTALLDGGPLALTTWSFYAHVLVLASVAFWGFVVLGLLVVLTVPRVLARLIKPDVVYPLYGLRYWAHRAITRLTNRKFFTHLFGDSSFIVGYLSVLGYRLGRVEQTGSNFGLDVRHETPYLASVGTGTVVADGLSFVNADFSSTSFRVSRASVGARNFIGNNIAYPSQGRTGDNCLLATKVMVPIDGPVREGVGLLGSPSFEIPRSVARDAEFDKVHTDEVRRRVAVKNRHNLVTMALFLLVRWIYTTMLMLVAAVAVDLHHAWGGAVAVLVNAFVVLVGVAYWVLVERAVRGLMALTPDGCSIYDRAFWRHERFWKVITPTFLLMFNGTPMKNVVWRLLGVRIGRRVFDDGCAFIEKTFVTVGDRCTLNFGSIVQCHSQEDGAFKSDRTAIGAGVTLGVGAFVHYGVTMGDGAVLAADSFLMKGEEVPPHARWGCNPAKKMREHTADLHAEWISRKDHRAELAHSG